MLAAQYFSQGNWIIDHQAIRAHCQQEAHHQWSFDDAEPDVDFLPILVRTPDHPRIQERHLRHRADYPGLPGLGTTEIELPKPIQSTLFQLRVGRLTRPNASASKDWITAWSIYPAFSIAWTICASTPGYRCGDFASGMIPTPASFANRITSSKLGDLFTVPGIQRPDLLPGKVSDSSAAIGGAVHRLVVDYHQHPVTGALYVELEPIHTGIDRMAEGCHRIFGRVHRTASMGDELRRRGARAPQDEVEPIEGDHPDNDNYQNNLHTLSSSA